MITKPTYFALLNDESALAKLLDGGQHVCIESCSNDSSCVLFTRYTMLVCMYGENNTQNHEQYACIPAT